VLWATDGSIDFSYNAIMRKTVASIIISFLLSGAASANTEGTVNVDSLPQVSPTPVAQPMEKPAQKFQNERFQHPGLELALEGKTISSGANGDAVKRVQVALIDLGFGLPAGADGAFGGQTTAALKAFQSSRGIPETGKIDKATLKSLDKVSPAVGKKVWQDARSASFALPKMPVLNGKSARAVVDLSEHRLTIYNQDGTAQRVYPVASGAWGTSTDTGVKVVYDKVADPSPIAWALWPESRGGAFGTRMLDLSWYDPATGASTGSGEELHGTYARDSIGTDASHGCVRMQNEDVEWVYQNLNIGDIVVIQP
jgi:L,D-transpeptidase YnhG